MNPSEEGGRIDVRVQRLAQRCRVQVRDTGVGLVAGRDSLGTGLATLRERLQLAFAGDATLTLNPLQPHGVIVTVEFPAQAAAETGGSDDAPHWTETAARPGDRGVGA